MLPKPEPEQLATSAAPLLENYLEVYLADVRVRLKPQTVDYINRTFHNAVLPVKTARKIGEEAQALGTRRLDEIDFVAFCELTRVLHERGLSAKTINNVLSALRALLAHAVERELLAAVPRVEWQKMAPTRFDFFAFGELAQLLVHAPPFVVLAARTGMRIGEIVALKWSDISLEREQVTVSRSAWWDGEGRKHEGATKNYRARTIPLSADALAALRTLERRQGYVFVDPSGQQLRPSQLKWPLWRAQDAAGLRRTGPHVLRHTFASHLVMRGVAIAAVQALMGHSTLQMTMKYAHLAPDHLRSAIDALTVH